MNLLRRIADAEAKGCLLLEARPSEDGTPSVFRESVWGATALYGTFAVLGFAAYRRSLALAEEEEAKAKAARRARAKIVTAPTKVVPWEKSLPGEQGKALSELLMEHAKRFGEEERVELTPKILRDEVDSFRLSAERMLGREDPAIESASDYYLSEMIVRLQSLAKAAEKNGDEAHQKIANENLSIAKEFALERWTPRLFPAAKKAAFRVRASGARFGIDVRSKGGDLQTREDFASEVVGVTVGRVLDTMPEIVERSMRTGVPIFDIIEEEELPKAALQTEGVMQRRGLVSTGAKTRRVKTAAEVAREKLGITIRGASTSKDMTEEEIEARERETFQEIAPGALEAETVVRVPGGEGRQYIVSYIPQVEDYIDEEGRRRTRRPVEEIANLEAQIRSVVNEDEYDPRTKKKVGFSLNALERRREGIEAMVRSWFTDAAGNVNQRAVDQVIKGGEIEPILLGKSQSEIQKLVDANTRAMLSDENLEKRIIPGTEETFGSLKPSERIAAVQRISKELVESRLRATVEAAKSISEVNAQIERKKDEISSIRQRLEEAFVSNRRAKVFDTPEKASAYYESLLSDSERKFDKISRRLAYLNELKETATTPEGQPLTAVDLENIDKEIRSITEPTVEVLQRPTGRSERVEQSTPSLYEQAKSDKKEFRKLVRYLADLEEAKAALEAKGEEEGAKEGAEKIRREIDSIMKPRVVVSYLPVKETVERVFPSLYEQAETEALREKKTRVARFLDPKLAKGLFGEGVEEFVQPQIETREVPGEVKIQKKYYITRAYSKPTLVPNDALAKKLRLGLKGERAANKQRDKLVEVKREITNMRIAAGMRGDDANFRKAMPPKAADEYEKLLKKKKSLEKVIEDLEKAAIDQGLTGDEIELQKKIAKLGTTAIGPEHPLYPKSKRYELVEEIYEVDNKDLFDKFVKGGGKTFPVEAMLDMTQFDESNPADKARLEEVKRHFREKGELPKEVRGVPIRAKLPAREVSRMLLGFKDEKVMLMGDVAPAERSGLHQTNIISRAGDITEIERLGGLVGETGEYAPRGVESDIKDVGLGEANAESFGSLLSEGIGMRLSGSTASPITRFALEFPDVHSLILDDDGNLDLEAFNNLMEGDFDAVIGGGKKNPERDKLIKDEKERILQDPEWYVGAGPKQRAEKAQIKAEEIVGKKLRSQFTKLQKAVEEAKGSKGIVARTALERQIQRGTVGTYAVRMAERLRNEFGKDVGVSMFSDETYAAAAKRRARIDLEKIDERLLDKSLKSGDVDKLAFERAQILDMIKAVDPVAGTDAGAVDEIKSLLEKRQALGDIIASEGRARVSLDRLRSLGLVSAFKKSEPIVDRAVAEVRKINKQLEILYEENPGIPADELERIQAEDVRVEKVALRDERKLDLYEQWARSFNQDLIAQGLGNQIPSANKISDLLLEQQELLLGEGGTRVPVEVRLKHLAKRELQYGAELSPIDLDQQTVEVERELDDVGGDESELSITRRIASAVQDNFVASAAKGDAKAQKVASRYDLSKPLGRELLEDPILRGDLLAVAYDTIGRYDDQISALSEGEEEESGQKLRRERDEIARLARVLDAKRSIFTFKDMSAGLVSDLIGRSVALDDLVETSIVAQERQRLAEDPESYAYQLARRLSKQSPARESYGLQGAEFKVDDKIFTDFEEQKRAIRQIDADMEKAFFRQAEIEKQAARIIGDEERENLKAEYERLEAMAQEAKRLKEAVTQSIWQGSVRRLKEYRQKYPELAEKRALKPFNVVLGPSDLYDVYRQGVKNAEELQSVLRSFRDQGAPGWLKLRLQEEIDKVEGSIRDIIEVSKGGKPSRPNEWPWSGPLVRTWDHRRMAWSSDESGPALPMGTTQQVEKLAKGQDPFGEKALRIAYFLRADEKNDDESLVNLAAARRAASIQLLGTMYQAASAQMQLDELDRRKKGFTGVSTMISPTILETRPEVKVSEPTLQAQKRFIEYTRTQARQKEQPAWVPRVIERIGKVQALGRAKDGTPIYIPQEVYDPGDVVATIEEIRTENEDIKKAIAGSTSQEQARADAALALLEKRGTAPVSTIDAKNALFELLEKLRGRRKVVRDTTNALANAQSNIDDFTRKNKRPPKKPLVVEESNFRTSAKKRYAKGSTSKVVTPLKPSRDEDYWFIKFEKEERLQIEKRELEKVREKLAALVPDNEMMDRLTRAYEEYRDAIDSADEDKAKFAVERFESELQKEVPVGSSARVRTLMTPRNEVLKLDEAKGPISILGMASQNLYLASLGLNVGSRDAYIASVKAAADREAMRKKAAERAATERATVFTRKVKMVECPRCGAKVRNLTEHTLDVHTK